jgi:hypothetical protein
MAEEVKKEIWKNASAGLRFYIALTAIGEQTTKTVNSGRTFTISALERRLNQEAVYGKEVDPFRDGTFLLVRQADDTEQDEIESPNSVTDAEIETAVREAMGGDSVAIEMMIERVGGINTAQRIYEEAVAADAPGSVIELAKAKVESLEERPVGVDGKPIAVGERDVVTAAAMADTGKSSKQDWKTKIE